MKSDEFFSIWSKFLSAFNNAKNDVEKSSSVNIGDQNHHHTYSSKKPYLSSSYDYSQFASTKTATRNIQSSPANRPASYFQSKLNANLNLIAIDTAASSSSSSSSSASSSSNSNNNNNFDRLCTDVRQCKFPPSKTTTTPNRLKIRSINDFNLPHCRSSSES